MYACMHVMQCNVLQCSAVQCNAQYVRASRTEMYCHVSNVM